MATHHANGETNGFVNSTGFYEATNLDKELYSPEKKLKICVTGAAGFIASNTAKRLKSEGHYVVAADSKKNEHMPKEIFCDEFHLVDLRLFDNCMLVTKGVEHVFNFAGDMDMGMGFNQSNPSVITYFDSTINFNMLKAASLNGINRFCSASSACIYPKSKQLDTACVSLKPQDAYGLQKLATEELCKHYTKTFGMQCRIACLDNIYGPYGTWKGGREEAPATLSRKAITSTESFEMWGDGKQTRSSTSIDECVEGVLRLTKSEFSEPVNLGSDEIVRMKEMAEIVDVKKRGIPFIIGADTFRNSVNTWTKVLFVRVFGWAPSVNWEVENGTTLACTITGSSPTSGTSVEMRMVFPSPARARVSCNLSCDINWLQISLVALGSVLPAMTYYLLPKVFE